MPAAYVKPYVKRNKTDGRDAEAICEAMGRPSMRFVAVKSVEQQAVLALHRSRALLVRQRTMLANAIRALCAEFGVVAPTGAVGLRGLIAGVPGGSALPEEARRSVAMLGEHWDGLDQDIAALHGHIVARVRENEAAKRLMAIPGIGPVTASAIVATVPEARLFRSARGFAAWLGLTPRQNNSAARRRSGAISKQGERYLRTLLIIGASAHLRQQRRPGRHSDRWLAGLLARRPVKVACVARAAKTARIVWALLAKGDTYRPAHRPA